jgi:uncharacterized protein
MLRTMTLAAAAALAGVALAAGNAAAQQARAVPAGPSTIRVSATGEARAEPDRATLELGVETQAATAQQAGAENARRMDAVIQALVRSGIPRNRIQTRNYMVFPDYDHGRPGVEPRIRGYRVSNTVVAVLDDVPRAGAAIDAGLAAGANRITGIRFGFQDPERVRALAIQEAIRSGRAEAEAIAAGLNVRLGRVLDASTSAAPPPMPVPMARMEAAMAADVGTPVVPGEQALTAVVHLVFAIE